jgi:hypothetical protein
MTEAGKTTIPPQTLVAGEAIQRLEEGGAVYSEHVGTLVNQLLEVRNQTSDLVRYVGFGLVAFFFFVANSTTGLGYRIARDNSELLLIATLFGCLTIAFDYLNLVFRHRAQAHLIGLIDSNSPLLRRSADGKHYLYDPRDTTYWLSGKLYLAKQIAAVLGCIFIIAMFLATIVRGS